MIVVIAKIKEILDDIKSTIEWILAGCPKPAKVKVKNGKRRSTK